MKSLRPFLMTLLLALTLTACQNDYQKHLRLLVNSLNEECPIPLGAIGHMDKADYDGEVVTFYYSLTGVFDFQSLSTNQEQFHQYMLDNYRSNSDESFRQLISAIVKAKADLKVIFSSPNNDPITLHFTNKELSDNMPTFMGDPEAYLQSSLQSMQLQLPMTYSEGMICSHVELDSNYFTYYLECDENLFDINEMAFSAEQNHDAVRDMLTSSSDPSFVKLLSTLKETDRGLRYLYTGTTSGKEALVTIESEEL